MSGGGCNAMAVARMRVFNRGTLRRFRTHALRTYESLMGVEFEATHEIPSEIRSRCTDAERYEPTSYRVLPCILRYIGSDDVFIDLGCGKGRVVCFVASKCRLKKVIGIEIVPQLVRIAMNNLANSKLLSPAEVIESDVRKADLTQGTVYYLLNPFGEKTVQQVLKNIEASLDANPRKIHILYYNPLHSSVLDQTGWLHSKEMVPVPGKLRFCVWHN